MVVGEAERPAVVQISPHGLLHSSYSCFCPLVEKIYSCVVHVCVFVSNCIAGLNEEQKKDGRNQIRFGVVRVPPPPWI